MADSLKKHIAKKITDLVTIGTQINFDPAFMASLTEAMLNLTDEQAQEMATRDERIKKFYRENHEGKEASHMEMSMFYCLNRPTISYNLSKEEMVWFDKMILSLSAEDFGFYRLKEPPSEMVELTRAVKHLCAVNDPNLIDEQEDAFAWFIEHSEVFNALIEAMDSDPNPTPH